MKKEGEKKMILQFEKNRVFEEGDMWEKRSRKKIN